MPPPSRISRVATYRAKHQLQPIPLRLWLFAGLGLLVLAGASALARRSHRPIGSTDGDDAPRILRIHRSDIRGNDPTGSLRIRCRFCAGGGKTWYWAEIRQHGHTVLSFKDHIISCPGCGGSGVISTRDLPDTVRIVPDDQPTDYNEGRLVR